MRHSHTHTGRTICPKVYLPFFISCPLPHRPPFIFSFAAPFSFLFVSLAHSLTHSHACCPFPCTSISLDYHQKVLHLPLQISAKQQQQFTKLQMESIIASADELQMKTMKCEMQSQCDLNAVEEREENDRK